MGTISRGAKAGGGTDLNSGQVADPAEVNTDLNTAYTEINGLLDDANIETATIPGAKSLRFTEIASPSSPGSNDILLHAVDSGGLTRLQVEDSAGKTLILGLHTVAGAATADANKGGAVGVLFSDGTAVPTGADTNETTFYTYTLPAAALTSTAAGVRIRGAWGTAANGNNKRARAYFGSTVILDTTATAFNNVMGVFDVIVQRTGAATQVASGFWTGSVPGAITFSNGGLLYATPGETLSGTVIIKLTGTNGSASAGDISGISMTVEMLNIA